MLLGAISCAKVTISWDQKPQVRESMPKRDKADLKMKIKRIQRFIWGKTTRIKMVNLS